MESVCCVYIMLHMNSKFSAFHVHIDTLIIMVSDFDIGGVNLLGKALWFYSEL